YDGGHKWDRFLTDTLGNYVEFVPVCPEVECGLGTPREAMHLVGDPASPRLVTVRSGVDHTERMLSWARRRVVELEKEDLCGFIFKSKSPSSGMERVKVYGPSGPAATTGVGLFARAFMEHFPLLPVEEEGRLHDPRLRESFIEAIFTLKRWREMLRLQEGRGALVDFHTRHKLLLRAHSLEHLRQLGKLVAQASSLAVAELYERYQKLLLEALGRKTTTRKNTDVLYHLMGHFKKDLSADEKQELREIIDRYHLGLVPLIVPVTVINHYVRKYDEPYLKDQWYLHPHPVELQLRNHV
ncbi:MAG: YbgA family protein, partial [Thermodesulfobacteriota bacterium]